jgi:hypothetical protein
MKNSSLEITDQEYLIKLSREDFNLSFIRQLLKRIQAEQFFFDYKDRETQNEVLKRNGDIDRELRFDDLRDK